MKKRVISWLLTVVMVVSLLPTSVLADTLAADQEQQTQQEQTAPADTDSNVPTEDEETQEQQEPAEEVPVSRFARSGGAALALAEGTVSSAKEFAAMEPDGNYQLTADITVTAPYGNDITGFTGFTGTFDGNGHTVTLDITASTANVGLFSKLAGGAVVKNVITAGSVTTTGKKCVAGIAGYATDNVKIENCKNTASITGNKNVGGILGEAYNNEESISVGIKNCANEGAVNGTGSAVGGIVGKMEGQNSIIDCYNRGNITGFNNYAGIVGQSTGALVATIKNCYSVGAVTAYGASTNAGYALIGGGKNYALTNCYAIKQDGLNLAYKGTNATTEECDLKSADDMKSAEFAATLGSAFQYNVGGYPTLKDPEPVVEKNVVSISVKSAKTTCYTGDELELSVTVTYDDNSSEVITKGFTVAGFDNTAPGKQTVTVTYKEKTDSIEIEVIKKPEFDDFFAGIVNSVEVTNDATYPYVVDMTDSDGLCLRSSNPDQGNTSSTSTITLKAKANVTLSFKYWGCNYDSSYAALTIVKNNSYNPEMRSWGSTQWKDFTIDLKKGDTLRLNLIKTYVSGDYYVKLKDFTVSSLYEVKLTAEPKEADAVVALKDSTGAELKGTNGVYIVSAGEYTYTVSAYGYDTVTETINVAADVAKTVPLTKSAAYSVAFDISRPAGITADPTVTVKTNGKAVYTGDGTGCSLSNGSYAYTVACDGCDNAGGIFSVNGDKVNITVTLAKKAIFEDFFANCQGITVSGDKGKFTIEGAGKDSYLKTTETTTLALTATKNVKLSFSYIANAAGYVEGDWDYDEPDEYYYFTIKKNSTQVKRADSETSWKDFSVELTQGDVLTISYDGYTSYYYAALKNFAAVPFYTLTLKTPDGATVVLKDRSGAEITGSNGAYTVAAGTYTYTVSKFGYETKTGNITVSADVNETVTLSEIATRTLTFAVTPADATVTVTHPVGGTIAADENGAYIVYAGETYAYTVAKADYITVSGSFTAAKNDTITVTLTYAGAGWDGTTKTAPKTENGVYQIGTAAELAWFADAVNNGQTTISGKLTANINLNGKPWTAIGTSSNKFAGTLDGDNYTVSGLVTTGLVGELAEGGVVENLRVNCAIVSTSSLLGGVANSSAGTIRNCMVSGSITFSSGGYNGASAIGGIAGRTTGNGVISGCVSRAVVKDAYDNSTYGTSAPLGGIAGYAYGVVENCYFTGTLAVKKTQPNKIINQKRGGLVGELNANAELKGSYVAGEFAIADESKFGAVVGKVNSGATITNCAYLDTVAPQAAADGTTSGMTAHTADYMRSAEFAVDMGMNQDDGTLNGGFPVLPWQGGTVLSADDLRAVSQAQQSLSLRGMSAADAAKKAKADWYAENVLGLYDLTDYNDKADLCKEYGIEEPGEAVTDLHDYFLTALQKHFYKELGLDAENADLLKADATGVYQIKGIEAVTVMLDDMESDEKVPCDCTTSLILPSTVQVTVNGAEKTVAIDWKSDNGLVTVKDDGTAAITAPAGGKATVTLKATLTSGSESKVKTFTLCLWSKAAEQQQTLDDIVAVITARNAAVRPLQGVGLYNDTTDANGKGVEKAFRRLLEEMGYADVADKAVITYTDGSAKASGFDGAAHEYITANGDVKFFDGAVQLKEAYYAGLEFKVAYGGVEKTITTRAIVGRSFDDVQAQLTEAAKTLTWEMIRGENTNEAETNTTGAWDRHAVVGGITSNLTLPYSISGRYDMQVQWAVVDVAEDSNCLYISSDKDSASGVGNIVRPVRPAEGELPEDAGKETLIARVTYTDFDDDPYIKEHITGQNGVEVYADVFFDITVAPFDIDATNEMQMALKDKYQSLLVDFVDKTTKPDLRKVDADLQMPRPYLLQQEGIMTDSYNQKVTMVSLTPDVLGFNGYHAMVYRPLPGEEAAEARYVVTITTRSSGQLLARQEFSFTIQPFTQQELDGAAVFMTKALTGDVYWNGIKNENTDKTNVTSDLYPFAEICKNKDGTLEYVRGTVNMTFDGIEADDIPGWLDTEKYRCFRSSRPSVIENELLRVHRPEYNTTVTLDSVLTYTKYAQYWEKFGINGTEESKERYKDFAQFYKQPIQIDLTVPGTTGQNDPNENQTLTVKVEVDGYNKNGHTFTGISGFTFTGKANEDPTAWDAVKACLDSAKYTYTGSGAYIKSITDAAGHTLKEKGDGKSSGWMFGIAVKDGNETLPKTTLDNTYLKDGDTLRLFFTDTYIPLDPTDPVVPGAEVPGFDEAYAGAKAYIQSAVSAPVVSYLFGEWAVLGQARAKVPLSEAYIAAYYEKVVAYVKANIGSDGVLVDPESHNPTVTDNERIILALTAIGKDPANVGGENLLKALQNKDIMKVTDTSNTDINGLVMGLLALNSRNYTSDTSWLVQAVLEQQNKDGSWRASADTKPVGDVDMTAMALQALAPYHKDGGNETVNTAVEKALNWLSGKYRSGYDSSESCAQVVIALSALNLDANTDARFTKTVEGKTLSVLGNLLQYRVAENGGFKHQFADKAVNEMATEQALCAMAAYARFTEKANALYDMTDAACAHRFGEWQVTVAATCTKDGVSRRICSICGAVEEKPVPATGHKFGAWTVTKAATCTESGISTRKCSVCGTEETMIVPSLGHSMTATAGKAATCTEAGNSAYWSCSRCHKFFSDAAGKTEIAKDSWVIAALGHDEATRAAVAATCYASGHEADTYCKRCGIVITAGATIPATGKHTYVNGVCTVCGVKNPMANVKGDDIKVDSKDNTIVTGGGLVIKADDTITGEVLADIKAAVSDGAITVTVTDTLQLTNEQKAADGGKSALTEAAKMAGDEVKKELNKLAEKLDALRGDKSRKNAQLEKVVDVTVALVKTEGNEIKTVAQLIELPHSVTVTIPITDELYAALQGKHVCVVRSHTDSSGNVTTAELSATLGGTKGNYVLTFQTDKASAFAIVSYETVSSGYYYGGSGTADSGKKDSANTADDSQMVIWLGSAVLAAAAVVVLTRKKRVSK